MTVATSPIAAGPVAAAAMPTLQQRQQVQGAALQVGVGGMLLHDAAVRIVGAPGAEAVLLEVWLAQRVEHHPHAVALFAAWHITGDTSVVPMARQLAAGMRAGTYVLVRGEGLETGKRAGEPVLRIVRPSRIARVDAEMRAFDANNQRQEAHHVQPA